MVIFTVWCVLSPFLLNQSNLPEEGSNFLQYKSGAKLFKMDTVTHVDFESILVLYSTSDKEYENAKKLINK